MKQLMKEGVGMEMKQAQPLTPEQEEKMWSLGIFGVYWMGSHKYRLLVQLQTLWL